MNAKGAAILSDPQPCGHIVYPYTDESQVADAVCLFASAGLRKGEAILLVMTAEHFDPILNRLERGGFDVDSLIGTGQIVCEEAGELLASFMFDGIIDEHRFKTLIGGKIDRAKAVSREGRVRVFGEMVNLIWRSRPRATLRLEELWNDVIQKHSVPLMCAYALTGDKPESFPESLLTCHSHALA
jgi:hypothetical protein